MALQVYIAFFLWPLFCLCAKKANGLLPNFRKNAINNPSCSSSVVVTHHLAKVAYASSILVCCFFYALRSFA